MTTKRILIVDDDADFIDATQTILKKRGYEIYTASNGAVAMELVQKEKIDLIITDVIMPEADGFLFYKNLRINPLTLSIPIIVISTRGSMEDSFRAIGVDEFLHKPFTLEEIVLRIEEVFKKNTPVELEKERSGVVDQNHRVILTIGMKSSVQDKMAAVTKESGYTIENAETAAQAISKINKLGPKMIFIDIHFKEISPGEMVRTLRCLPACKNKPMIGYSAVKQTPSSKGEKDLETISLITDLIHAGANQYMGPYDDYNFINILIEHSEQNLHSH